MNFKSDNTAPVHPQIIEALLQANHGHAQSYGQDPYTLEAKNMFKEIFEKDVHVFFVSTGSIANGLALSTVTPSYGMILSAEDAHVQVDEANCVELMTGGAKLKTLPSNLGKIQPEALGDIIKSSLLLRPHMAKPSTLTLTQATEWGTVYTVDEITHLCDAAHAHGLKTHMDGARFANALAHLNKSPAELTWQSGIDILSFGATKNGALQAEAIVIFDPNLGKELDYKIKQSGQLPAKQRYWAAQFQAYFYNDLWLQLAAHANSMAYKLANTLEKHGYQIVAPIQSNEVFVKLPIDIADKLMNAGVGFYPWGSGSDFCYRMVTSWYTTEKDINSLEHIILVTVRD